MRLSELTVLADDCLERIRQGDERQFENLLSACIPFLLCFRKKFGYFHIPVEDVKEDLAFEAINRAFINHETKNKPFSFFLINAFRDCCRRRTRTENSERITKIVDKCGLQHTLDFGQNPQPIPPDVQVQRDEFVEQVRLILKDHPSFSKKLVFEKMRGATFPEMVSMYRESLNECKRVYQHDIYHIRKNINRSFHNETQDI